MKTQSIQLGKFSVGPGHDPFIIAEMSGNHNQSLDRAMELIEAAAKAGVHALKLQTYTAETMTLNLKSGDFFIDDSESLWHGHTLYDLYEKAHTPWDWHEPIFKKCRELGMECFSTPFDTTAVDFLESLDVPFYKVASFENTDVDLIAKVAGTGKPVIMSTGMASINEIAESVQVFRDNGCRDLILLKCTSSYPASPTNSHLKTIPHLAELFNCQVGLSDHTLGLGAAVASVALGATVIEKHFTLSRSEESVDAAFSLEPQELKQLVEETKVARMALGEVHYGTTEEEVASRQFRRTLYFAEDLSVGEVIGEKHIRAIRPGGGLPVKYRSQFLGKRVSCEIKKGTPVSWDALG